MSNVQREYIHRHTYIHINITNVTNIKVTCHFIFIQAAVYVFLSELLPLHEMEQFLFSHDKVTIPVFEKYILLY